MESCQHRYVFSYNKNYLCVVDYCNKFPAMKKMKGLSADNLILPCKVISLEYGLLKTIISDAGGNFISDKIKEFCKKVMYRARSIIILPPSKQWSERNMH